MWLRHELEFRYWKKLTDILQLSPTIKLTPATQIRCKQEGMKPLQYVLLNRVNWGHSVIICIKKARASVPFHPNLLKQ